MSNHIYDAIDALADREADPALILATMTARATHAPSNIDDGGLILVRDNNEFRILTTPGYDRDHPVPIDETRRNITVADPASLRNYLTPYSLDTADMRANRDTGRITVCLDAVNGPRNHQAALALETTPDWEAWTNIDGCMLGQIPFAEFVQDHLTSIARPDGGQLVDICQTLAGTRGVEWKSGRLLANGQVQFRYEETVTARAGQAGDLTIPTELTLAITPYRGCDPAPIRALFRYRIDGQGAVTMGVKLVGVDDVLDAAFTAVTEEVAEELNLDPIYTI